MLHVRSSEGATIKGTPKPLATEEEESRAVLALYTVYEYVVGMAVAVTGLLLVL